MSFRTQSKLRQIDQCIEYARQNGYGFIVSILEHEKDTIKQREKQDDLKVWILNVKPEERGYAR